MATLGQQVTQLQAELAQARTIEARLRSQVAQSQQLLEAVPDLLLRVQQDGACVQCILPTVTNSSDAFIQMDLHLSEVLPPHLLQQQLEAIRRALATGECQTYEHELLKYNEVGYEEVRVVPLNQTEVLVMVRDIGDRKQREQAQHQIQTQLRDRLSQLEQTLQELQQTKPDVQKRLERELQEAQHANVMLHQLIAHLEQQLPPEIKPDNTQ
jgi:PAS fold